MIGDRCRVCGCSDYSACAGGCWWLEPDLCSSCAPAVDVVTRRPIAVDELLEGFGLTAREADA